MRPSGIWAWQSAERGDAHRYRGAAARPSDPHAAVAALAPVLNGVPSVLPWIGLAHAFLLEAIARDALGDEGAAGRALERALDLIEPDGALSLFLLHPAPGLLKRHARHGTAHAVLIAEILSLLAGQAPAAPPPGRSR